MKKDIDLTKLIPTGRANAISMRELSERLNVDTRTTRALIQRARIKSAEAVLLGVEEYLQFFAVPIVI